MILQETLCCSFVLSQLKIPIKGIFSALWVGLYKIFISS